MLEKVLRYIREQQLLRPGERVAVACSGGADSVSLLHAMAELREELGIVLSAAHFHHQIRGAEADADQQFVQQLAATLQVDFYSGSGSAPDYAAEKKISLETAARELRHQWFAELIRQGTVDKIATAHTLDDQAETVLMRVLPRHRRTWAGRHRSSPKDKAPAYDLFSRPAGVKSRHI